MAFDGVIGDNSPSSAAFRPWAQPDAIAHVARIVAALDAVFSYGFKPEMGYERGIVSAADAYDEAAGEFGMEGRAFFFQQRRRSIMVMFEHVNTYQVRYAIGACCTTGRNFLFGGCANGKSLPSLT